MLCQEVLEKAEKARNSLVPLKSSAVYNKEYNIFMNWCKSHKIILISETVILAFFQELSEAFSPNSLWTKFSMIRKILIIKKDVPPTTKFPEVELFLKHNSRNYYPKKSRVLTRAQILKFLNVAPVDDYLLDMVILVIGVFGACRRDELVNMLVKDVSDVGVHIVINIPQSKNGQQRSFVIIEDKDDDMHALKLIRQYISLRPPHAQTNRFFLQYRNKKCTIQPVGKNLIGCVPAKIAKYLGLPDAEAYTGHCLRRTSATLHSDAGGNTESLKRLGGWKSSTIAQSYVNSSHHSQLSNASLISGSSTKQSICAPSTSTQSISEAHISVNGDRFSEMASDNPILCPNFNSISNAVADLNTSTFSGRFEGCTFNVTVNNNK